MNHSSLRQAVRQYLRNNRQGSPKTYKFRSHVLSKLTQDLYITGKPPKSWHHFNNENLKTIVNQWRKQNIKPKTMVNHLAVIRKFLTDIGCDSNLLTNNQLRLNISKGKSKKLKIANDFWQNVQDPLPQTILALQIQFGLTLSEAIRIKPTIHSDDNHLLLTREITFNSQDRMIPFRNELQHQIIESLAQLTQGPYCLLQTYDDKMIRYQLSQSLKHHKLPTSKSWRYLYAQWVNIELSKILCQYKLNWMIMDEMGVKSRTTLWRYLNE